VAKHGAQDPLPARPRRAESPSPLEGEGRLIDSAAKLAGLAGAVLGWRPDEFWRTTPAELAGIFEAMRGDGASPAGADVLARLKELYPDG
jgi:uncharacterized phage protein (TIGR02216 family)